MLATALFVVPAGGRAAGRRPPPVPVPSAAPSPGTAAAESEAAAEIAAWCVKTRDSIAALKWKIEPCETGVHWQVGGHSVEGRPLVFAEFGDGVSPNTTLVLTLVHGDEITPLFLGIQLAHWMLEHREQYAKAHVVIAPMVNPDGFYRRPRTRMNARGVDVNRNFATRDWPDHALKAWKVKFRSDPRRFPGSTSRSEPETIFQEELIRKFRPQKIMSVHSPLNHLDYDGPTALSLQTFPREYVRECLKLRKQLRAVSTGFFPGSLGNFAGQELGIPTLTLELPSADPRKASAYWGRFKQGIDTMIEYVVPSVAQGHQWHAEL